MKHARLISLALFSAPLVLGEVSNTGVARILGPVADGSPPSPVPAKPGLTIPPQKIVSSRTIQEGNRSVSIQEILPIPVAEPAAKPVTMADANIGVPLRAILENMRQQRPTMELILAGATIYRPADGAPLSLVTIHSPGGSGSTTFWSSADFALLTGFTSFAGADGIERSLMMSWSVSLIQSRAAIPQRNGNTVPHFPDGKARWEIIGDPPDSPMLACITALHEVYNNEYERLKEASGKREEARALREAALRDNPPEPENMTLNFWRQRKSAKSIMTEGGQP